MSSTTYTGPIQLDHLRLNERYEVSLKKRQNIMGLFSLYFILYLFCIWCLIILIYVVIKESTLVLFFHNHFPWITYEITAPLFAILVVTWLFIRRLSKKQDEIILNSDEIKLKIYERDGEKVTVIPISKILGVLIFEKAADQDYRFVDTEWWPSIKIFFASDNKECWYQCLEIQYKDWELNHNPRQKELSLGRHLAELICSCLYSMFLKGLELATIPNLPKIDYDEINMNIPRILPLDYRIEREGTNFLFSPSINNKETISFSLFDVSSVSISDYRVNMVLQTRRITVYLHQSRHGGALDFSNVASLNGSDKLCEDLQFASSLIFRKL